MLLWNPPGESLALVVNKPFILPPPDAQPGPIKVDVPPPHQRDAPSQVISGALENLNGLMLAHLP